MDPLTWLAAHRTELLLTVAALAVIVVVRRIMGRIRRRRPAVINPKLQKYAGRSEAELEADRRAAQNIIATGSTGALAGYEIVQQMEAVFVEGHRSPQEAMQALRAAAGRLGANAIINLTHERTTAGRCTASGDAVLVRPLIPPPATAPNHLLPKEGPGEVGRTPHH